MVSAVSVVFIVLYGNRNIAPNVSAASLIMVDKTALLEDWFKKRLVKCFLVTYANQRNSNLSVPVKSMKQGDFSSLAKEYINRPGYSDLALKIIKGTILSNRPTPKLMIADVGAGTGKLTEQLVELGDFVNAVEPNDAMRAEGEKEVKSSKVKWSKGSGEATGLDSASVDWLLMGSSFHWVDLVKGLNEFFRVLKPGGSFTAIWNPRNIESSELHQRIEEGIYKIAPKIVRKSSGGRKFTEDLHQKLISTGQFKDSFMIEVPHEEIMSPERYLGAWRSVNDIQAQTTKEEFERILKSIEAEISGLSSITVPYLSRAWTVRRVN